MSTEELNFHKICGRIINGETNLFKELDLSDQDIIVANFMQTKEVYIEKERHGETSYTLHFDYEYSKNILWDIYFLGRYIYEKSDLKTKEEIERKADSAVGSDYNYSGIDYEFKNLPDTFSDEDLKKLKRAIVAIQKVRDTFGHSNININDNCFELRNNYPTSYLKCDLPVKYLRFFGLGIVPDIKDKSIASSCNSLIEKHGIALAGELSSYHIPPSNIKRINDLIELEVQKRIALDILPSDLRQLSRDGKFYEVKKRLGAEIFSRVPIILLKTSKKRLDKLLEITGNDIEKLIKLPRFMYHTNYERIELSLAKVDYDLNKLTTYPEGAITCKKEKLERILEILENDTGRLQRISNRVFAIPIETINYLFDLVDNDVERFVNLPSKIYEFSLNKLKHLHGELGLSLEQLLNLDRSFIYCPKYKVLQCLKLVENDPTRLNERALFATPREFTPDEAFYLYSLSKEDYELVSNVLMHGTNSVVDIKSESVMFAIKYGLENKCDYDALCNLVTRVSRCDINFVKYIFDLAKYDINTILKIPNGLFSHNGDKLDFLLSLVDNKLERLEEFELRTVNNMHSPAIFDVGCDITKLKFLLSYVNNEPQRLSEFPIIAFNKECKIERLKLLLEYAKTGSDTIEVTKLKGLTVTAFTCSEERLKILYELGNRKIESLYGLSTFLFGDFISLDKINILLEYTKDNNGQYNFSKLKMLPWVVYKSSEERIRLVMSLIDNDITLLRTIPKELFMCSDDELVSEIYQQYSENMIKSIFGVSEEKTIALMLYMNSVFREKGKSDVNYKSFKFADIDVSGVKIKNINGNLKNGITAMLNRMCTPGNITKISDAENLQLSNIDDPNNQFHSTILLQNKELCRFLRNCSEHFTIWPQGNNKVKLVDGDMSCIVDVSTVYSLVNSFFKDNNSFTKEEWQDEMINRATLLKESFNASLAKQKWNTEYPELMGNMTSTDRTSVKQKLDVREQTILNKKADVELHEEKSRRNDFVKNYVLSRDEFNGLKKQIGYNNVLNDLYRKLHHMNSIGLEDVIIFKDGDEYKVRYNYNGVSNTVELANLWNVIITQFGEPEILEPVLKL